MALIRFGPFELDPEGEELRRNGMLIRLAPQPMQILTLLAGRAGEIVARDELRREVWGDHPTADLDRNLNVCIAQIRSALSDDADTPRWVQTVPRKGYRFLGQVGTPPPPTPPPPPFPTPPPPVRARPWMLLSALAVTAVAAIAAGYAILSPSEEPKLLAVLPFAAIPETPDALVDRIRHGLLDETITLLGAHSETVGVIARTSVSVLPPKLSPAEIQTRLNAGYIVEGTVRHDSGELRVTARLARADTGAQLWAASYDQNGRDPAGFERETAGHIATAVLRVLQPGPAPSARTHSCGPGWEHLRNARFLQLERKFARSAEEYQEAARDPRCPEALSGLAEVLMLRARAGQSAHWPEARKAADAAVADLPDDPQALTARGNVSFWFEWDWNRAEKDYRKALRINPHYAAAHHDYAWLLVATGRTDEGLNELRHAMRLDPISARQHRCRLAAAACPPV